MKMTVSELEAVRKDIGIVANIVQRAEVDATPTERTSIMRLESFAGRLGEVEITIRG